MLRWLNHKHVQLAVIYAERCQGEIERRAMPMENKNKTTMTFRCKNRRAIWVTTAVSPHNFFPKSPAVASSSGLAQWPVAVYQILSVRRRQKKKPLALSRVAFQQEIELKSLVEENKNDMCVEMRIAPSLSHDIARRLLRRALTEWEVS